MSIASTGTISLVFSSPVALPDAAAPDGLRIDQQISLTLKLASDDKEYQFNLPVTEQTIGLDQLEAWQAEGKLVTVLASGVRALPFVHDTSKDADGNPLKKYQRAGRKVSIGEGLTVETDAFVVFQAYDVKLAGQLDLAAEAQQAHVTNLRRQAEYRKRSVAVRIERAKELVQRKQAEAAAKAQGKTVNGATPAAAGTSSRKSA